MFMRTLARDNVERAFFEQDHERAHKIDGLFTFFREKPYAPNPLKAAIGLVDCLIANAADPRIADMDSVNVWHDKENAVRFLNQTMAYLEDLEAVHGNTFDPEVSPEDTITANLPEDLGEANRLMMYRSFKVSAGNAIAAGDPDAIAVFSDLRKDWVRQRTIAKAFGGAALYDNPFVFANTYYNLGVSESSVSLD